MVLKRNFSIKNRIFEAVLVQNTKYFQWVLSKKSAKKFKQFPSLGIGLVSVLLPILLGFGRFRYRSGSADTDTDTLGSVNHYSKPMKYFINGNDITSLDKSLVIEYNYH